MSETMSLIADPKKFMENAMRNANIKAARGDVLCAQCGKLINPALQNYGFVKVGGNNVYFCSSSCKKLWIKAKETLASSECDSEKQKKFEEIKKIAVKIYCRIAVSSEDTYFNDFEAAWKTAEKFYEYAKELEC